MDIVKQQRKIVFLIEKNRSICFKMTEKIGHKELVKSR